MKTHPVIARMITMHPEGMDDYVRQIVLSDTRRTVTFHNDGMASGNVVRIDASKLPSHTSTIRDGLLTASIDLSMPGVNGYVGFQVGSEGLNDLGACVVVEGPLMDGSSDGLAGAPIEVVASHPLLAGQVIADDRPIVTRRQHNGTDEVATWIPLADVRWLEMPLSLSLRTMMTLRAMRRRTLPWFPWSDRLNA